MAATTGLELLKEIEASSGLSKDSAEFAEYLDKHDTLSSTREQFDIPLAADGGIYFAAHALGACPKTVGKLLQEEVQAWSTVGTKGHVSHPFDRPWVETDKRHIGSMANIVGALPSEVVYASGLSTNLHILLQSFYRPTSERFKIIYEYDAFNSDRFAFMSQAQLAGYDPANALVGVTNRPGENYMRHEDIFKAIEEHGDTTALVMFGAVNWASGQFLDMPAITAAGHAKGCLVGWDIAHGVGGVPVQLHDWNVDFAVWCSYKYLCAGPGATAGFFVHEKHTNRARCSGWWGNDLSSRFITVPDFKAREGAAGFVLSNPSVLATVPLHASLAIFAQVPQLAGQQSLPKENGHTGKITSSIMLPLRRKGKLMTAYLEYLLEALSSTQSNSKRDTRLRCVSPRHPDQRGSTLSVLFEAVTDNQSNGLVLDSSKYSKTLEQVISRLKERNVLVDSRAPSLIRFAPAPLYNTYQEVWKLAHFVVESLEAETM